MPWNRKRWFAYLPSFHNAFVRWRAPGGLPWRQTVHILPEIPHPPSTTHNPRRSAHDLYGLNPQAHNIWQKCPPIHQYLFVCSRAPYASRWSLKKHGSGQYLETSSVIILLVLDSPLVFLLSPIMTQVSFYKRANYYRRDLPSI